MTLGRRTGAGPPTAPAHPRGTALLVGAAAAVVVAAGVQAAAWLVAPALLALVVVVTARPVDQALRRHGLPGWAATAVFVLLVQAVVLVIAAVLVISFAQLAVILPGYAPEARALLDGAVAVARDLGISAEQVRAAAADIDVRRLAVLVGGLLTGATGLIGGTVFLLSVLLFAAVEAAGAGPRLVLLGRTRPALLAALGGFALGSRRYLVVTTVFGLAVGVVDAVALAVLGVPLPLLWGLLVFLTNYVPYLGFWFGLFPPVVLALLAGGWRLALVVFLVFSIVNFVLCSLVQPRFIGDAVGLSVTVTFLGLAFWGWLLGPVGAVLAVPLTLLVKAVLVDAQPGAGWADALLASSTRVREAVAEGDRTNGSRAAPVGRGGSLGRRAPRAVPAVARRPGA